MIKYKPTILAYSVIFTFANPAFANKTNPNKSFNEYIEYNPILYFSNEHLELQGIITLDTRHTANIASKQVEIADVSKVVSPSKNMIKNFISIFQKKDV